MTFFGSAVVDITSEQELLLEKCVLLIQHGWHPTRRWAVTHTSLLGGPWSHLRRGTQGEEPKPAANSYVRLSGKRILSEAPSVARGCFYVKVYKAAWLVRTLLVKSEVAGPKPIHLGLLLDLLVAVYCLPLFILLIIINNNNKDFYWKNLCSIFWSCFPSPNSSQTLPTF